MRWKALEDGVSDRRGEGAFMAKVLHRLGVDAAEFANRVMRPSPKGKIVGRANFPVRYEPCGEPFYFSSPDKIKFARR